MNIRLLIVIGLGFTVFSCKTISEATSYTYENYSINTGADSISDAAFMAIFEPYKQEVDAKMSEVIGYSDGGLISYRPESPLSNFLSDMLLDVANDYCERNSLDAKVDISLFNHGGIRGSIPKGEITVKNAYEIMPFENEIVMVQLTGEQVIDLADYITTRKGEGVGGITFGMYGDKAENIKVQGIKIDKNKKYWLVTSDYIANGGDGMTVLTWADKRIDSGMKIRDVIINYLKAKTEKGEKIQAKSDRRIYYVD